MPTRILNEDAQTKIRAITISHPSEEGLDTLGAQCSILWRDFNVQNMGLTQLPEFLISSKNQGFLSDEMVKKVMTVVPELVLNNEGKLIYEGPRSEADNVYGTDRRSEILSKLTRLSNKVFHESDRKRSTDVVKATRNTTLNKKLT